MTKFNQKHWSEIIVVLCVRWLGLIAILHIVGGLALSFDFPEKLWFEYRNELMDVFNMSASSNTGVVSLVKMLTQLFGPTIASWGLLMLYLLNQVDAEKMASHATVKAINTLIFATLIWFALDSFISYKFNMMVHLAINSLAVIATLTPLIYLRLQKRG